MGLFGPTTGGGGGASGASAGMPYLFSADTTDTDPTAGYFKFNNATGSSITELYISLTDSTGIARSGFIGQWDDSSTLANRGILSIAGLSSNFGLTFSITGPVVVTGGYAKVPVVLTSGMLPVAGSARFISFSRTGDAGSGGEYELYEHFWQGNVAMQNLSTQLVAPGSVNSAVASRMYNSQGVITLTTGSSTSASASGIGVLQAGDNAIDFSQSSLCIFTTRAAFFALPTAANSGLFLSGFIDSFVGDSVNGAYFKLAGDGNLVAVTISNGVATTTDLGVRPATGTMNLYEVVCRNGTSVQFQYNKSVLYNSTTNIPASTANRTNFGVGVSKQVTAAAAETAVDVDLVFVKISNTGFVLTTA